MENDRAKWSQLYPSRPARGAWVEIVSDDTVIETENVAPRKGRVG